MKQSREAMDLPETARIVPRFSHEPGSHCASTALADLARWNGLPWSEALCFGLGAGIGFTYIERDGAEPSRLIIPRTPDLELTFFDVIGLPRTWRHGRDPAAAWEAAREELDAGRPVLLLTDLYYLDYYETTTHFSGHALVLAGYDPETETAYTADTERPGLQRTSLASLARARRSAHFPTAIDHHWLPGGPWQPQRPLNEAVPDALLRAARYMLEPAAPEHGVSGMRLWAERVEQWRGVPDWSWTARFAYQIIERRGTGGSAFRRLYRDFLREAETFVPALGGEPIRRDAQQAVDLWREAAFVLRRISLMEEPSRDEYGRLRAMLLDLAGVEERLFTAIAQAAERA